MKFYWHNFAVLCEFMEEKQNIIHIAALHCTCSQDMVYLGCYKYVH